MKCVIYQELFFYLLIFVLSLLRILVMLNRYSGIDDSRSGNPLPMPRNPVQSKPVPLPRKTASGSSTQLSAWSPGSRSVASRNSNQAASQGAREKDKKRATRSDAGYSTASSSTRESPGGGRKVRSFDSPL